MADQQPGPDGAADAGGPGKPPAPSGRDGLRPVLVGLGLAIVILLALGLGAREIMELRQAADAERREAERQEMQQRVASMRVVGSPGTQPTVLSTPTMASQAPELPIGMVAFFTLPTCPLGWAPLPRASGRVLVVAGLPELLDQGPDDQPDPAPVAVGLGQRGGASGITLTAEQMPRHRHGTGLALVQAAAPQPGQPTVDVMGLSERGFTDWEGEDQPIDLRQPFLALLACVKE